MPEVRSAVRARSRSPSRRAPWRATPIAAALVVGALSIVGEHARAPTPSSTPAALYEPARPVAAAPARATRVRRGHRKKLTESPWWPLLRHLPGAHVAIDLLAGAWR